MVFANAKEDTKSRVYGVVVNTKSSATLRFLESHGVFTRDEVAAAVDSTGNERTRYNNLRNAIKRGAGPAHPEPPQATPGGVTVALDSIVVTEDSTARATAQADGHG